jgi:hypothetical protein
MSGFAERAGPHAHSVRPPILEGRTWQPGQRRAVSRLELVKTLDDWMPYPVSPGLVAIDLAVACLEADEEPEAFRHINRPAVLDVLAAVIEDALGTGDLADGSRLCRSRTILGLHRDDLATLSRMARRMPPPLKELFIQLGADERLRKRARATAIQTLLSTAVAQAGAHGLMGDDRPVTRVDAAPIDLGIVPPRVFSWEGPERNELRLIRTVGASTMEVRIEVAAPGAIADDYIAFVTLGDRTAEAPLRRIGEKRNLRATVDFGPSGSVDPGHSLSFGIRHRNVSREWAGSRIATGEAKASRYLVEAWARLRFGHATMAVTHIEAEKLGPVWTSSVHGAAKAAQRAVDASRKALVSEVGSLTAEASVLQERNEAARLAIAAYLSDASQWDPKPTLSGPQRPLLSETYFVIGAHPASLSHNVESVAQ